MYQPGYRPVDLLEKDATELISVAIFLKSAQVRKVREGGLCFDIAAMAGIFLPFSEPFVAATSQVSSATA